MVDIFWKNARNRQAVLRAVPQRNEGVAVGVFVLFEGFDTCFVESYGGREARAGELVAFEVLFCVDVY